MMIKKMRFLQLFHVEVHYSGKKTTQLKQTNKINIPVLYQREQQHHNLVR